MTLRLAFMGTPDFAVPALSALIDAGHSIAAVYSQPPRPSGRGQKEQPSAVHRFAASRGLAVHTPATLRAAEAQAEFAALNLDAAIVAAYGLILPQPVLDEPRLGCFNIHGSLLPRWRGAAPIHRAILAGDVETGITIMRMEAGLDTGPMLLQEKTPIMSYDNTSTLHDRLAALGARMMVEALARLEANNLPSTPQPADGVTYAAKIGRDELRLDWTKPADELVRVVRAFAPAPGAWFERGGERIKVLAARPEKGSGKPGVLLDNQVLVACGSGALRLLTLQRAGRGPLEADAFLRGYPLRTGETLTAS